MTKFEKEIKYQDYNRDKSLKKVLGINRNKVIECYCSSSSQLL